MTAISIFLVGLFLLFTVIQLILDYRLKYINKDGRTNAHVSNRQWLFWITVVAGLISSLNNVVKDRKSDAAQKKFTSEIQSERQSSADRATNLTTNFEARISIVADKQAGLLEQLQRLSITIATNSATDPKLGANVLAELKRLEAIDTNIVDVSAWISELQKNRAQIRIESAAREQSEWDAGLPVYEYAIKTLERMLTDVGKQNGKQLFSNYRRLPVVHVPLPFDVAEMSFGTNSGQKFSVKITKHIATQLQITSVCSNRNSAASLRIQVLNNATVVDVEAASQQNVEKIGSAKDYKESVDWGIRNFVAAHVLQCNESK